MLVRRGEVVTGPWAIRDIVCLAIVGPVLLAAFLEAFLWVAAFCYCLGKAYKKADHWTSKALALFMTLAFVILRGIFLPVTIATLPLPVRITQFFPHRVVALLQQFAFYSFAVMLIVPWLFCVYRIIVTPLGRRKRLSYALDERTAPKVVVVMPVYKEPPDSLWKALTSVVDSEYPGACIHVFLSFDGEDIDELYLKTIDRLGIPITLKDFPKSIDVVYHGVRVTVSRFPHGGKRHCQKATFFLIDKIYKGYLSRKDDLFILFIDSDCILDAVCLQNFMYDMELKPGIKHHMLAMTGIITCSTEKHTFLTLMQDMEYVHGQLFERSVESGCGAVTCLPGALTLLRFSAFRNMAKFYFSDRAEECDDLFDYAKTHLGEDRWLTHLFMLGAPKRYQIQMSTSAFCKTEAVQTFRSLLKQRRRWFLGFITNEVCMMTDWRLWKKYPLLCILRFLTMTVRTTALLMMVTVMSVASTSTRVDRLPWEFMCISCGLNWLLMLYFAAKLHRWKAVLYPVMFILNPFLNWIYIVYGIFTAGQRTWGGPRADAGAADAKVTPQEAIEQALATGDELNVVPETFRHAIRVRRRATRPSALQPSSSVEGRFVTTEHTSNQWGEKDPESPATSEMDVSAMLRRKAHESLDMSESEGVSIHTPQQIESVPAENLGCGSHDIAQAALHRISRKSGSDDSRTTAGYSFHRPEDRIAAIAGPSASQATSAGPVGSVQPPLPVPASVSRHSRSERGSQVSVRSPLGRNSPLMTITNGDDFRRSWDEEDLSERPRQHTQHTAPSTGNTRFEESQQVRRCRSPGNMV